MATTTAPGVPGTVKVGRWTYPAKRTGKVTLRNTKRDGSGDWEITDADFVEDDLGIPGFISEDPGNPDRDELRAAYEYIFSAFAVTAYELASQLGVQTGRAKALIATLCNAGLTVTDQPNGKGETVVQSLKTYDDVERVVAMADFEEKVPAGVHVRAVSAHGGKVGAQHKRPGRSTWKPGDQCPQGHTLAEGDIYVMPSGRKQCRKCRSGYGSNA